MKCLSHSEHSKILSVTSINSENWVRSSDPGVWETVLQETSAHLTNELTLCSFELLHMGWG